MNAKIWARGIAVFCFGFFSGPLIAQQNLTLHFLKSVPQSSYTNPAFNPRVSYQVGLPVISSASAGYVQRGFVYNDLVGRTESGDSLVFQVDKAMEKNDFKTFLSYGSSMDLFFAGYGDRNFYLNLNITERTSVRASYTKDLVNLLWYGNQDMPGERPEFAVSLNAMRYRETGIKFSYHKNQVSAGVRLKFLSGLLGAFMHSDSLVLLETDSVAYRSVGKAAFELKTSGLGPNLESGATSGLFSFQNSGFGADIGFEYKSKNNRVELAFSARDLGFIRWSKNLKGFSFQKEFNNSPVSFSGSEDTLDFKTVSDSVFTVLQPDTNQNAYTTSLASGYYLSVRFKSTPRVNLGALVYFEVFDKKVRPSLSLHYGFKVSKHIWSSLNYAVIHNTYGNLGGSLVLKGRLYQFFLASDNLVSLFRGPLRKMVIKENVAAFYLPPNSQVYSICAGLNFLIDQPEMPSKASYTD